MKFIPGKTYWVEHPEHGTVKAELRMASPNEKSLLFKLEHEIALRPGGGVMIMKFLGLDHREEKYACILSGQQWEIFDEEPKTKLPTK